MRSLKPERKTRNDPRTKTVRKGVPGPREAAAKTPRGGRRAARDEDDAGLLARLTSRRTIAMAGSVSILALVLLLLVSGWAGRAVHGVRNAANTVMADAGFAIHNIHIAGERRTPQATITAALDLHTNESIFAADLTAARARLLALDWIASAEVVRRYPDSIYVTLVEKRPFALWQTPPDAGGNAHVAIVERAGGVITTKDVESFVHLPKLVGAGAPQKAAELVDAVAAHRAVNARMAAFELVSQRRWNLILADGVIVKLPEAGWRPELDALERLIIDKGILERDIAEIDMRSPTHYFFTLKSGEQKDVTRGGKET